MRLSKEQFRESLFGFRCRDKKSLRAIETHYSRPRSAPARRVAEIRRAFGRLTGFPTPGQSPARCPPKPSSQAAMNPSSPVPLRLVTMAARPHEKAAAKNSHNGVIVSPECARADLWPAGVRRGKFFTISRAGGKFRGRVGPRCVQCVMA